MDFITGVLIAIIMVLALILGCSLYPNKEKYVSNVSKIILYLLVALMAILIVIFAGMIRLLPDRISDPTIINAIAVWSVIIALVALVNTLIVEMNNHKIFSELKTNINQNTKEIIAQINNLDKSQKTAKKEEMEISCRLQILKKLTARRR
jgi:nitrogen fixation/metabolism regulation signal transduction histidine kinase